MAKSKKANYSKEIEEIKRLRDLSTILKAGDMENALLSNAAKETETLNDNVLDRLLEGADAQEHSKEGGLEVITKLTTNVSGGRVTSERRVKLSGRAGGAVRVKKAIHVKKAPRRQARKGRR